MKVAIFHNFLDNIGGAEIVDLIMARELNADIYTTNIDREKIKKMGFSDIIPHIYSIGKVPINAPLKQECAYWRFRFLNVEKRFKKKYDCYVIAGDWAMSGAINNKPSLWYVFSPTREIWDLYKYTRKNTVPLWQKPIFDLWVFLRRIINKHDVKKIGTLISISKNTRKRVKKYLKKESSIIYPPIETKRYYSNKSKDYWLSVNRLILHKRVHIQLKAFKNLPNEKLIIVGSYEKSKHFTKYANYCKKNKTKNVEIKSWVNESELLQLYANCKGLIFTSKDEDFGLTVLEAMAAGKPVIAPNEGGCKETIIDGKTGLLIDNINSKNLANSIKNIKNYPNIKNKECRKRAMKFDTKIFIGKMKSEIKKKIVQDKKTKKSLYVYFHVHKCAGTSFGLHMEDNLRENERLKLYKGKGKGFEDKSYIEQYLQKMSISNKNKLKVIYGHGVYFGIHKHFTNRNVKYILIIRDPFSRTISNYNYFRGALQLNQKSTKQIYLTHKDTSSFNEWFKNTSLMHNYITKFLLRRILQKKIGDNLKITKKDISDLKKIINTFYLVGTVKDYDTTISPIYSELNISRFTPRAQVSKKYFSTEKSSNLGKIILDNNTYDLEIYKYIKRIMRKQVWAKESIKSIKLKREKYLSHKPFARHEKNLFLKLRRRIYILSYHLKIKCKPYEILINKIKS